MEKQKWINKNAINDWELENTQRATRIVDDYWRKEGKRYETEEAKMILKTGNPYGEI